MNKVSRYFVMTFACCALVGLLFLVTGRSRKTVDLKQESPVNSSLQELTFRHTMIFDGETKDGARYAHNIYKSSDCATVSDMVVFFKSPARATAEVEAAANRASAIVERRAVVNDERRQIGDLVVLEFGARGEEKAYAEVAWNKDGDFRSVTAPSLELVLAFEKALDSQAGKISSRIDAVQKLTFSSSEGKEGRTDDGFRYYEKQFRSSDCETVITRTEYFPSTARAQQELAKKLKESTNIIERGSKLNASGQLLGERVVAMFKAESPSDYVEDTVIMWTVDSELHSIKGLFTHVLELERRNYRYD